MQTIDVRNVHAALPEGIRLLQTAGERRESRNGPVLVARGPVTTVYRRPEERVMLWPDRDCNPFFHLMEALWMLAGRNDVEFPASFVKRMREYSDDGRTFHGAYGHRWRQHFGFDQLGMVAEELRDNPDSRRCVVQMWDAKVDLGRNGKDLPCNTQVYFGRRGDGALDMTVCNRSNDVVWGAYGANAVHFSVLQEYVAAMIGCPLGSYWQISNNFHGYVETFAPLEHLADQSACVYSARENPYETGRLSPFPLVSSDIRDWNRDLMLFLQHPVSNGFRDPFFARVARPVCAAHRAWSDRAKTPEDRFQRAAEILLQCDAVDWRVACEEWLERRLEKLLSARDEGVHSD